MNYENQPCPVCSKPLRGGEDVVVCPVCATPQHRECWMVNGRCANDDLHASGYIWKRERIQVTEETHSEQASDSRVCHICGSENPADSLHCGNCGALFSPQAQNNATNKKCSFCGKENDDDALHCNQCGAPLGTPQGGFFGVNPKVAGTDFDADEKIGDNTAGELAIYTQASAHRYLPKFKKFESGQKISFNFAAFFFAPYWFFYRKLYKAGIFFLVAFVTASILLSGYSDVIYDTALDYSEAISEFNVETASEEELEVMMGEMEKMMNDFYTKIKKPMLITLGVTAALRLICALTADKLYYKKIVTDIKLIKETVTDPNMKRLMIAKRGGLSALAFTASFLGETMLINLLFYAADFIKNI